MRLTIKVIAICLVVASLILAACAEKKAGNEIQIIDHNLSIHKFGGDVLQSIAAVDGNAKNISNLTLNSAYINVNFYDKDGNLLQTASTSKQNWATGEIWHFNIQFTSPDAWKTVRYDISASTNQ
jgi:predicted small secreted protein